MPNLAVEDLTTQQEADFRAALGLGTAATATASSFATASQGTDERVPTAAGLTTKFSTVKATLVDADRIGILDSAASLAPKHSLFSLIKSTLLTYFDGFYVKLTGGNTIAGNQAITGNLGVSGTITAPTVQATTTAGLDIKNSNGISLLRVGKLTTGLNLGFASGVNTTATNESSHAQGQGCTSSGVASHAEGYNTSATGDASHSEGSDNVASGYCSHASGQYSTASAAFAHASGRSSKATHSGSRVLSDSQAVDVNSSAVDEYTARYAGGYRFLGGTMVAGAAVRLKGYTVATLPAGPTQGDTAFVTNALAPAYLAVVVGGGTVVAPVIYNGTQWVTH